MKTFMTRMVLCAAVAIAGAAGAATGESWKSLGSLSLGKTQSFTLVAEKNLWWESGDDADDKYYDSGCYYFKISCKRGTAYTVYTSGLSEDDGVSLDVSAIGFYNDKETDWYSSSFFDISGDYNYRGSDYYYGITADDWDEDDPATCTFVVYLSGEIGQRVTVSFVQGITGPPVSYGDADNPQPITVSSSESKFSSSMIDGWFYFTTRLTADSKYKFWTSGGTEDSSLSLDAPELEADEGEAPVCKEMTGLDDCNQGWIVKPVVTGTYTFAIGGDDSQAFTLNYGMITTRTPEKHAATVVGTPTVSGFADEACAPGFRNNPNSGYYDDVIDETLYQVTLVKGETYAFATEGAVEPLRMEIYDAKGAVVTQDGYDMSVSGTTRSDNDCILTYTCTAAGKYWVGVCEEAFYDDATYDEETDAPSYTEVTFTARKVTPGEDGDDWDPADDSYTGTGYKATALTPGMGSYVNNGPHRFSASDSADWYSVAARSGLTYGLKSVLDTESAFYDERMAGVRLTATVYTAKAKVFATIADLAAGGSFTAAENGTYYICVRPALPAGQDYGSYTIQSKAEGAAGLGALEIDIGGTDAGRWQITAPVTKGVTEPQYEDGQSVFLDPAKNPYTISFTTVKDWSAPAALTVNVIAGETLVYTNKYSDSYDVPGNDAVAGDGSKSGKKVTTLKPANKDATVSRSLWTEDEADWFKVAVVANTYYRFALTEDAELGDAEIAVFRENGTDLVMCGTSVEFLCRETKANYYVKVRHATPEKLDSQYTMTYTATAVGAVSFAKTAVSVADTAASVSLTVNRSAKEGRVRVHYATCADSAMPGVNYVPVEGWLEWANGDSKAKTVTITLIPDLVARWEANRAFTVKLETIPFAELEEDEYVPALVSPTATITITEATKMSTGTITATGYGDDDMAFATPTKPAVTMPAGESLKVWFERTGGSDGTVAVTVTPTKGTAVADTHFDATPVTLVWEDGETEAKSMTLQTFVTDEAYMSAKTLTLKVAADKTVSAYTAKVGTGSVSVTLLDPQVSETVETYAASFGKSDGITVKAGKTDTWYFDEVGSLRSVTPAAGGKAELTVTLTGPGRFVCCPTFVADEGTISTCTATIGKETVTFAPGEETAICRYLGKGSTTVKFTLTRVKPSAKQTDVPDDSDIALVFADLGDASPFDWTVLPMPTLVSPLATEVAVAHECEDGDEVVDLMWSADAADDVVYLLSIDANAKNLGTANARISGTNVIETVYEIPVECSSCWFGESEPDDRLLSGKAYSWRVDTAFMEDGVVKLVNTNTSVWTLTPAVCNGTVRPKVYGVDATGADISTNSVPVGTAFPVSLVQGVAYSFTIGSIDLSEGGVATYALAKGSTLPTGLTLKNNVISGVPTKTGTFTAVIQASETVTVDKKKTTTAGATQTLTFTVEALNLATGSFTGLVQSEEDLSDDAVFQFGSLAVTTTDAGKITAKLSVGGTSYAFSATSWSGTTTLENGQPGVTVSMTNVTKITTTKTATTPAATYAVTNVLTLAACRGTADDPEAADTAMTAGATLSFLSTDKTAAYLNVAYAGTAARDNRKEAALLAEQTPFVGYYTVSLVPQDVEEYIEGYGYLTLTVDAKGAVKVAGVLADGSTKPSLSGVAVYVSESEDGQPSLSVPLYYAKGKMVFGGTVVLRLQDDGTPVVDGASSTLYWINADTTVTYAADHGFAMALEPVGGYYNTLYNLQAYYLGYNLKVGELQSYFPDELLGSNEDYVCTPWMFSEYLTLAGNSITMSKQVKATRTATVGTKTVKLTDWENSVNPANLTFTFKQATGIFSGAFEIWAGNGFDDEGLETSQVKIGSYSHQGVLLMNRDTTSAALSAETAMAGFWNAAVTVPYENAAGKTVTRKFNASLPFTIEAEDAQADWSESWNAD